MRSVGDLMKDMGFNADAPIETQKAFIRHLIKAANGVGPASVAPIADTPQSLQGVKPSHIGEAQLSFDPDILGVQVKRVAVR